MNKLYVINWTLPGGYVISVSKFWSRAAFLNKMRKNPEWTFETVEDNFIHTIVKAS